MSNRKRKNPSKGNCNDKINGIDLGTTNSVVSNMENNGYVKMIPTSEGKSLIPSCVSFSENSPKIYEGSPAVEKNKTDFKNTLYDGDGNMNTTKTKKSKLSTKLKRAAHARKQAQTRERHGGRFAPKSTNDYVLATTTTTGKQTNGGSPKKMQSRSSPGRGQKGPQFQNSGPLPSQRMETIKTELVPVSKEGSAIPIKMENYEKFSLGDEIVCSALKSLAEKMKLRFIFNNWIQNEKDQLLTLINSAAGLRSATAVVAFVDSQKMENSLTDRLVLLAEFDESEVDRRQTFELVEFERGEVSAIERLFTFDQSEFLSDIQKKIGSIFGAMNERL